MNKKLLIIVVIIIAVSVGGYYYSNNTDKTIKDSGVVTNDETTGWATYINKEYNFSFKYPLDSIVKENPDRKTIVSIINNTEFFTMKIYYEKTDYNSFDEYSNNTIKEFENYVSKQNLNSSATYSFEKKNINKNDVLFHKRNFHGLIGHIYNMSVWLGNGDILKFSGESEHIVLDQIYNSFTR